MAKPAHVLSEQEPYAVTLMRQECAAKQEAFDASRASITRTELPGSAGTLCEQQVAVYGHSAIWTSGGAVRMRFTTPAPLLQATWACFNAYGAQPVLCLLQRGCITSLLPSGETHDTPLLQPCAALWPLPQGLLLVGPQDSSAHLLAHPLDEPRPVAAHCTPPGAAGPPVYTGWSGEAVVWTSRDLPLAATFSDSGGRVALWRAATAAAAPPLCEDALLDLPAVSPAGLAGAAASALRTPPAPLPVFAHPAGSTPLSGGSFGGVGGGFSLPSASTARRTAVRTPDGRLSADVFNPTPRGPSPLLGLSSALPTGLALPPPPDPSLVFELAHCEALPPGAHPTQGALASDGDGAPLLALLCPAAQLCLGFRLPLEEEGGGKGGAISRVFATPALAVAAVAAAAASPAHPPLGGPSQPPLRSLLLLRPSGQLELYRGRQLLVGVTAQIPFGFSSVPWPASAPSAAARRSGAEGSPPRCLLSSGDMDDAPSDMEGEAAAEATPPGSWRRRPPPPFGGSAAGGAAQPTVVGIADAAGDRVTLRLSDGGGMRVALPFAPCGGLPALALAALEAALEPEVAGALVQAWLLQPGSCSGRMLEEWAALCAVLRRWAAHPASLPPAPTDGIPAVHASTGSAAARTPPGAAAASQTPFTPERPPQGRRSSLAASSDAGDTDMEMDTPAPAAPASAAAPLATPSSAMAAMALATPASDSGRQPVPRPHALSAGGSSDAWQRLLARRSASQAPSPLTAPSPPSAPADQDEAHSLRAAAAAVRAAPPRHALRLRSALAALHSVYEDCKLHRLRWHLLRPLGEMLAWLASSLGFRAHWEVYARELGAAGLAPPPPPPPKGAAATPAEEEDSPPDVLRALAAMMHGGGGGSGRQRAPPLPLLARRGCAVVARSLQLVECFGVLGRCSERCSMLLARAAAAAAGVAVSGGEAPEPGGQLEEQLSAAILAASHELVLMMVTQGWDVLALETLPLGVALPLREALSKCREAPPAGWPVMAYALVGREDVAATLAAAQPPDTPLKRPLSTSAAAADAEPAPNPTWRTPPEGRAPTAAPGARAQQTPALPPAGPPRTRRRLSLPGGAAQDASAAADGTPPPAGSRADARAPSAAAAATDAPPAAARSGRADALACAWQPTTPRMHVPPYSQRLLLSTAAAGAGDGAATGGDGGAGGAGASVGEAAPPDGMECVDSPAVQLRFGRDARLREVRQLLGSSAPCALRLDTQDTDLHLSAKQQAALLAAATRTLALAVGRGAFTLGTLRPPPTEPLAVPLLCLSGRTGEGGARGAGALINLDLSEAAPAPGGGAVSALTAWPEFHNGVAAGLRLARLEPPDRAAASGAAGTHAARDLPGRGWVAYARPAAPSYAHAGVLMALGLTGHLAQLSWTDLYRHLSEQHDATTIGVLLGLAASRRGSCDPTVSRALFLHLPARHPSGFPEIELSAGVQAAALLGVGLLHQGTCERHVVETLLGEVARRPGDAGAGGGGGGVGEVRGAAHTFAGISQDVEGYALAAGLALGLVTLGRGRSAVGLSDLRLEEKLRRLMVGGVAPQAAASRGLCPRPLNALDVTLGAGVVPWHPAGGDDPSGAHVSLAAAPRAADSEHCQAAGLARTVLEGGAVNTAVTAPAATLALALQFLRTGDAGVAAGFQPPATAAGLAHVRPDHLLLRVLGRALVLWDSIEPTPQWMDAQLPPLLAGPLPRLLARLSRGAGAAPTARGDAEAVASAAVHASTGAALALGLRFAGTRSAPAERLLRTLAAALLAAKRGDGGGARRRAPLVERSALEACVDVVVLALCVVMAGSGHLPTLRLLQHLSRRLPASAPAAEAPAVAAAAAGAPLPSAGLTHGNHMALSMAAGFLFMGAGSASFGTSNAAVAALLVSLFPSFPTSSQDQRCHLQAFRHLYVMAAEQRCVEAVDVDTRRAVHVPLTMAVAPTSLTGGCSARLPGAEAAAAAAASPHRQRGPVGRAGDEDGREPVAFVRMAPCLLPERAQVTHLGVRGPRYWQQHMCSGGGAAPPPTPHASQATGTPGGCGALHTPLAPAAPRAADASHGRPDATPAPAPAGAAGDAAAQRPPRAAGEATALERVYAGRRLFVKKRSGALSYCDDPSGIRSLLSQAFTRAPTPPPSGREGGGAGRSADPVAGLFDIVHLCDTFSADPFVSALSRSMVALAATLEARAAPGVEGGGDAGDGSTPAGASAPFQPPDAAAFLAYCHGALYECVLRERPAALPWYCELYCLVQCVCSDGGSGGAGPTTCTGLCLGLWSLKLARSYYSSGTARAVARCCEQAAAADGGASSAAAAQGQSPAHMGACAGWLPLLQPMLLDSLWAVVQKQWQALGLLPSPGGSTTLAPAPGACALAAYLRGEGLQAAVGAMRARCGASVSDTWLLELLGGCLSLHELPHGCMAAAALATAAQQLAHVAPGWALSGVQALPLLAARLPEVPAASLLLMAQCL